MPQAENYMSSIVLSGYVEARRVSIGVYDGTTSKRLCSRRTNCGTSAESTINRSTDMSIPVTNSVTIEVIVVQTRLNLDTFDFMTPGHAIAWRQQHDEICGWYRPNVRS